MKKIFLYILLNVFIHNAISRNSNVQDYPFVEEYISNDGVENSTCKDLICPESKLTVVQIELLLRSFNEQMNVFAERKNISNAFKMNWDTYLAQKAQNKSGKCLPPTHENDSKLYYFYEDQSRSIFEFINNSYEGLEVLIGERNTSHPIAEELDKSKFNSRMVEYYTKLFFSSSIDLASRALNNVFGCGYVYIGSKNSSTVGDRLLCIFGFWHRPQLHILTTSYGIPCSQCEGFPQSNSESTNDTKKISWGCDDEFAHLCAEINLIPVVIKSGPFAPYCPIQFVEVGEKPIFTPVNGTGSGDEVEVSEWPCLPILIPLAILIVIFLAIAIYHFVTALKFPYNVK